MHLLAHTGPVLSVAFSPDGKTILTNTLNNGTFLWDTDTLKLKQVFTQAGNGTGFALYAPNGRSIFSPSYAFGEGILFDTETGTQRRLWNATGTFSATFSRDGGFLLIGGGDGEQGIVQCLDLETGDLQWLFETHREGVVDNVAYTFNSAYVLASVEHEVCIWENGTGRMLDVLVSTSKIHCLVPSPDDTSLLGGCDEGILLGRIAVGRYEGKIGQTGPVHGLAFSPDGSTFLSGGKDGVCRLWKWPDGDFVGFLGNHDGLITSVAFSPDGKTALTGSYDTTARLWPTLSPS